MASASFQHSILYRGENPATAVFEPKLKNQQKVTRHRAGQEPAFVRQMQEVQEKEMAAEALKARPSASSRSTDPNLFREDKREVRGGAAQNRVFAMAQLAQQGRQETMAEKMAKRRKVTQAVELDSDSDHEEYVWRSLVP